MGDGGSNRRKREIASEEERVFLRISFEEDFINNDHNSTLEIWPDLTLH